VEETAEFHPVDFKQNFILVGHDGPHNVTIAQDNRYFEA
jgi:L-arabinose isomerase